MTKREALRQTQQENTLMALGFTRDEAEALRRISMTLHRWHELECGMDHSCIVRGRWNHETQTFEYDDNGQAYIEYSGAGGKNRYVPTRDRETGAKKRLAAILAARNDRAIVQGVNCQNCQRTYHGRVSGPCAHCHVWVTLPYEQKEGARHNVDGWKVLSYIQTDPRGAALYIIRPGDVPEGKDVQSYYTRGVCVY